MFDAVLSKQHSRRSYASGFGIALVVYSVAIGLVVWMVSRSDASKSVKPNLTVTLFTALESAPPPPAPPPAAAASEPQRAPPKRTPVPKPVEVLPREKEVVPTPVQQPEEQNAETNPPEAQPAEAPAGAGVPGGVPGGVAGGVAGGVPGGLAGGVPGGTGTQVLPFGPGMLRPVKISGTEPTYSAQALAARVEGKVLVRCVISVAGSVEQCQVIKGVPLLTELVLAALRETRFRPVEYLGRPQAIQYLFTYNFKLP